MYDPARYNTFFPNLDFSLNCSSCNVLIIYKSLGVMGVDDTLSYPVPHSRHRLAVADPSPRSIYFSLQFTKKLKTTCPKVENENIVHVQFILHLLKTRNMMANIFLSHSYILVFPPKSLFSITLILICITLSLVTLLGNHFSFHFISLRYKRNVIFISYNTLFIVY